MDSNIHYISIEKKEKLLDELENRQSEKRREIIERLEDAKSLGDLSENAEYQQAREDQGKNENRIHEIEEVLKNSEIISNKKSSTVALGSSVTILKKGTGEKKVFTIVGPDEADMAEGKLSFASPLGSAIMGKKKEEEVEVETPSGISEYKIEKIN